MCACSFKLNLWDHNRIGDAIPTSFHVKRYFTIKISTQVLKLASRYTLQISKDVVSCLLIGNTTIDGDEVTIDVDRIECDLTTYLSNNSLVCSSDICIPFTGFKRKTDLVFNEEAFERSLESLLVYCQDHTTGLDVSKFFLLWLFAGFMDKSSNNTTSRSINNFNWIEIKLFLPDFSVTLNPIKSIPIYRSALISTLETDSFLSSFDNLTITFGFLSFDSQGRLQFLLNSDERLSSVSTVGVWIHGIKSVFDFSVVCVCLKYVCANTFYQRICSPLFPFLLAHITDGRNDSIKFYDVKWPTSSFDEQEAIIKSISFKSFSCQDSLDRYYSNSESGSQHYVAKFNATSINDVATAVFLKALKRCSAKYSRIKDDTIPRSTKDIINVHNDTLSNTLRILEISDVSLLNEDENNRSVESSDNERPVSKNYQSLISNPVSQSSDSPIATTKSYVKVEEAIPRPHLPKQQFVSPQMLVDPKEVASLPIYQQMPFVPQPIFPYPTYFQTNPCFLLPSNVYEFKQDKMSRFITKPPRPTNSQSNERKHNLISKMVDRKVYEDVQEKQVINDTSVIPFNESKCKATRLDLTNQKDKLSKAFIQLDNEDDLTMLENLVQQMINQKHHETNIPSVSVGTNTTGLNFDKRNKKIIEVSTDLPSFCNQYICARCRFPINERNDNSDPISSPGSFVDKLALVTGNNNEVEAVLDVCEGDETINNVKGNIESKIVEDESYSQLLINLEDFVQEARKNSYKVNENVNVDEELQKNEESRINVLEEAVRNLRELDMNHDFEDQYWRTLNSTRDIQDDVVHDDKMSERHNLDTTILLQRINYVSLFLNQSTSQSSSNSVYSRNSSTEQSEFIEELARKYLSKATVDLDRLRKNCDCSINSETNDLSIDTKQYLIRHRLFDQSEKHSALYYSSIKLPDGVPLPKKKIVISSTPDPNVRQKSKDCFRVKPESPQNYTDDKLNCFQILNDLKEPSILQNTCKDSIDSWPISNVTHSIETTNLLDIDKLRQLPKYL